MKPYIFIIVMFIWLLPLFAIGQTYLYPPLNLEGEGIECSVYLTWDKPELPGGGTPPGILGYNVYKEGLLFAYCSGEDTTWCYDIEPQPCPSPTHTYWVTAVYDLAYYGNPGQIGESGSTDTILVEIICSGCLPFSETWNFSSFYYNDWSFEPEQGNWAISTVNGNPPPVAVFTGNPSEFNYDNVLLSPFLPGEGCQQCTDIFIDFDLKLENLVNTGTEKLILEYDSCYMIDTLDIFTNQTGFDWTHYRYLFNQLRERKTSLRFRASGTNSSNIQKWLVDNIYVTFTCRPPVDVALSVSGNVVNLVWNPPFCDNGVDPALYVIGYNIYRSDENGLPPYTKLNSFPITQTYYTDVINMGPSTYQYYITDYQNSALLGEFLCESESSDTVTAVITGTRDLSGFQCAVYPNPGTGQFTVSIPEDAFSLEITNLQGIVICSERLDANHNRRISIDLSGYPKGIYLLTVQTKSGTLRSRIVIC